MRLLRMMWEARESGDDDDDGGKEREKEWNKLRKKSKNK